MKREFHLLAVSTNVTPSQTARREMIRSAEVDQENANVYYFLWRSSNKKTSIAYHYFPEYSYIF